MLHFKYNFLKFTAVHIILHWVLAFSIPLYVNLLKLCACFIIPKIGSTIDFRRFSFSMGTEQAIYLSSILDQNFKGMAETIGNTAAGKR